MSGNNDQKTRQLNHYKRTDVLTANRETILLMLYAGSLRFLRQAIEAMEKSDIDQANLYVGKTQEIITELRSSLNFEVGGEIAQNLERLYLYSVRQLVQATLDKSVGPLQEVLKIFETLNQGWQTAVNNLRKSENADSKAEPGSGHGPGR